MSLKEYLPFFESYTLKTRLSADEVINRISENIEPLKRFRYLRVINNDTKPYQGKTSGDTFKISRIIGYRNFYLPVILGHITYSSGETNIDIKMRPAIFQIIFMVIALATVGTTSLFFLMSRLLHKEAIAQPGFQFNLFTFCIFLFAFFLAYFKFKYESKKSKQFLSSLLEAEEMGSIK